MNLRTKLVLGCLSILLILSALTVFTMVKLDQVNDSYIELLENREQIKSQSKDLVINFEYSAFYMRSFFYTDYDVYWQRYEDSLKATQINLDNLKSMVTDAEEKEKVAQIDQALQEYIVYVNEGLAVMVNGPEAVTEFTLNRRGTINSIIDTAKDLANHQDALMREDVQSNIQMVNAVRTSVTFSVIAAIIIGIAIALVLANKISTPIARLEQEVSRLAKGDLTGGDLEVSTQDEVGTLTKNFNQMKRNLQQMTRDMNSASRNVLLSATTLAGTTQQVNSGSQVVVSTMTEITVTVDKVAQDAMTLSQAATEAATLASKGNEGLDKVNHLMSNISEVSGQVSDAINNLNDSSREITQIVDMITEIAEQTNLLALNAAIEAARAGEQGRGFAVVAEEVRKLAESSAQATRQIYNMINNIKKESEHAVKVMKSNSDEIIASRRVIDEVGSSFRDIIHKVQNLSSQVQNVAGAATEISSGVQNVASITEEQTASIQQLSALAQELNGMADELNNLAVRFKV